MTGIDGKQEAGLMVLDKKVEERIETFVVYEARLKLNAKAPIVELSVDARGQHYLAEFYANDCSIHRVMLKCLSSQRNNSFLLLNLDADFVTRADIRVSDVIEIDMASTPPVFKGVRLDLRPAFAKPIEIPTSVFYSVGTLKVQS